MNRTLIPALVVALLFASAGKLKAELFTFHFGGQVTSAAAGNPFGLAVGDPIHAAAVFEESLIDPNDFCEVFINSDPAFDLQVDFGSKTLGADEDLDRDDGYPLLSFESRVLVGLDFVVWGFAHGSFSNLSLEAHNLDFTIYNDDDGSELIEGVFAPVAIPEPSSLVLLGIGVVVLAMLRGRSRGDKRPASPLR